MTPSTPANPAPSAADNNAPTPRTETFILTWSGSTKSLIDFARTLERELTSAQAALAAKDREIAELADQLRIVVDAESFRARKIERERDGYKARAERAEAELRRWVDAFSFETDEGPTGNLEQSRSGWRKIVNERDALRAEVERLKAENNVIGGHHLCEKGHGWVVNGQPCYLCQHARMEAHMADRDKFAKQAIALSDEVAQLRAQLAAAQEDKERLDWLENQGQLIARQYRDGWHFDASNGAWVCVNATTLRDAIDAAKKGTA